MVRLKGGDLGAARSHLRYVQRDGVTREGEPGRLYDAATDEVEGKAFIERSAGDRHQFRFILRDAADGVLSLAKKPERDPVRHSLRMGRLRTLERLELAHEPEPGVWRIAPELDTTLRRMGERGDIIKAMHRDPAQAGVSRNAIDHTIFDPASPGARVVGRIVAEGVADELRDRRYLIVDSIDGRAHYVDLGVHADAEGGLPVVELIPLAEHLLKVTQDLIRTALDLELQDGAVIADRVGETDCVFLAGLHGAERAVASAC